MILTGLLMIFAGWIICNRLSTGYDDLSEIGAVISIVGLIVVCVGLYELIWG